MAEIIDFSGLGGMKPSSNASLGAYAAGGVSRGFGFTFKSLQAAQERKELTETLASLVEQDDPDRADVLFRMANKTPMFLQEPVTVDKSGRIIIDESKVKDPALELAFPYIGKRISSDEEDQRQRERIAARVSLENLRHQNTVARDNARFRQDLAKIAVNFEKSKQLQENRARLNVESSILRDQASLLFKEATTDRRAKMKIDEDFARWQIPDSQRNESTYAVASILESMDMPPVLAATNRGKKMAMDRIQQMQDDASFAQLQAQQGIKRLSDQEHKKGIHDSLAFIETSHSLDELNKRMYGEVTKDPFGEAVVYGEGSISHQFGGDVPKEVKQAFERKQRQLSNAETRRNLGTTQRLPSYYDSYKLRRSEQQ